MSKKKFVVIEKTFINNRLYDPEVDTGTVELDLRDGEGKAATWTAAKYPALRPADEDEKRPKADGDLA